MRGAGRFRSPPSTGAGAGAPASDTEKKILYSLISGACKHVDYAQVRSKGCVDAPDAHPDVDVLEATPQNQHIVLRKYSQMLDLYSIPGLNPMLPALEYTWKSGSAFYIKTASIADGVLLCDIAGSLTVFQLLLIMGDICFAMAASHSFDVAHTCFSDKCIVVARDLSRMKITQYGALGHDLPFNSGYARDITSIGATLAALATRKFVDIRTALDLVQGGKLSQAGQLLRHMAFQGIERERAVFDSWIRDVHLHVLSSMTLRAAPIDCGTSLSILKDMHVTVACILRSARGGEAEAEAEAEADAAVLPVFFPRGSVARGLGPATLVVTSYFNAVLAFGGLARVAHLEGLWPNGTVFDGLNEDTRERVTTQFFEALGYLIGYALCSGVRIHHPISTCIVCLTMCENTEYLSMDTMPDAYRAMATICAPWVAAMRRGFEPFRKFVRRNMWSVQQIYTFFFELAAGGTLREHPDCVRFRGFTAEEVYCIRQALDELDTRASQQFATFATCSPVIPPASDPIVIARDTSGRGDVERVSTCGRTVSLPANMVITAENVRALLAFQLGDAHFNCT